MFCGFLYGLRKLKIKQESLMRPVRPARVRSRQQNKVVITVPSLLLVASLTWLILLLNEKELSQHQLMKDVVKHKDVAPTTRHPFQG
jgi:hypothetical protein